MKKYDYAVVSDYDALWRETKKEALKIARDFKKKGAVYCYIQKMYTDGSGTAGALEYIFNQEEEE